MFADRTSACTMRESQPRMLAVPERGAAGATWNAQCGTVRARLLRVGVSTRRVCLSFSNRARGRRSFAGS